MFAMATLNQFNSNIFSCFSKQYYTCKNITIHHYSHGCSLMNSIEKGLMNLCKQNKSDNHFIKFDCCHENSWKLTQMLMLKSKTWRFIITAEEKCRQFNWCFQSVYGNHWPRRNILIKVTLSTYNGSTCTNLGHLKAVIPNQI